MSELNAGSSAEHDPVGSGLTVVRRAWEVIAVEADFALQDLRRLVVVAGEEYHLDALCARESWKTHYEQPD